MKKFIALLIVFLSLVAPAQASGFLGGGGGGVATDPGVSVYVRTLLDDTTEAALKTTGNMVAGVNYDFPQTVNGYTSGQTLTTAHCGSLVVNTSGTNQHDLPTVASLTAPYTRCKISFRTTSGTVTINTPGAETINSTLGATATLVILPAASPASVTLYFDGTNWQAEGYVQTTTTTVSGTAELATAAEGRAGTAGTVMLTPNMAALNYGTKGADVASGAFAILADGSTFDVTGTTAITALGTPATAVASGWVVRLKSEGAIKYVHNATSLILSGGKDLLTFDGDSVYFQYEGSGNWRMIGISRASGAPADPAPIRSVWTQEGSGTYYNGSETDGVTGSLTAALSAAHPGGVNTLSTGIATNGFSSIHFFGNTANGQGAVVGTNPIVAEVGFNIATLADGTDDYEVGVGFSDSTDIRATVDSIRIYYDRDTNTDWLLQTCNDSTCTNTDSNVPVATGNKRLTITINAAGTSVEFFLDGVSMGVQTTNIPSGTGDGMGLVIGIDKEAGTNARSVDSNFFSFAQYLTTPR
jgi:hypothetical protein